MSPNVNKEWAFTCSNCPYVPYRDSEPDEVAALQGIDADTPIFVAINPYVPKRCRTCETKKKRNQRMRERTKKIWRLAEEIEIATYHYPKLITFSLLTDEYYSDTWYLRDNLLDQLNKKMPKARKKLMENGILGGTFVYECNSRLQPIDEGQPLWTWRHHPHVHMVAIGPFIHHTKLAKWCEQLMPMGLGRINYKAPRNYGSTSKYIAKYLSKQGLNVRSFGIVRNYKPEKNICSCKHDDLEYHLKICNCIFQREQNGLILAEAKTSVLNPSSEEVIDSLSTTK